MIYFTSDTHFFHRNIIKYEDRPFKTVEEMNKTIIERWNERVSEKDLVYHLGDVGFCGYTRLYDIIEQLNGYKILIKGNHDSKSNEWYQRVGFDQVFKGGVILNDFLFLTHAPMYMNKHMPYINIHGHLHSKKMESSKYINVGVENFDYYPVSMDEIDKMVLDLVDGEENV